MKAKRVFFAILVGGLVLTLLPISRAVIDTSAIKEVYKKSVLTQQDLVVIDDFVQDVVNELVNTINFTNVAETRTIALNYRSTQAQYAQQYSEAAQRHIAAGLQQAQGIADAAQRFRVVANLLILIDSLKDPRLVDLAVGMIGHGNSAVRYWAVRAATDPALWAKIGQDQARAAQLVGRILGESARVVESSRPEVLQRMVEFAGQHSGPEAEDLLIRVAEARIRRYADWSVEYELMDTAILMQLCEKLTASPAPNPELAKQFAQLYSFVIQRYLKGQPQGVLGPVSRNHLASVIAEVEDKCLRKLLGTRMPTLAKAIQESGLDTLEAERVSVVAALRSRFNFTFGSADNSRSQPLPLPDPPAPQVADGTPPGTQP